MNSVALKLPTISKFKNLLSYLNWTNWKIIPYGYKVFYWETVKPLFFPQNKKIRKAVTRSWMDISSLIVDVNFAMIKQFYEDEYVNGIVDWEESSQKHKEFAQWLEQAYAYITSERKLLEQQRDEAYPPSKPLDEMFEEQIDDNGNKVYVFNPGPGTYEERYGKVNEIENIIQQRDTEILKELIDSREYFWT